MNSVTTTKTSSYFMRSHKWGWLSFLFGKPIVCDTYIILIESLTLSLTENKGDN
jgi:hypothetical protein